MHRVTADNLTKVIDENVAHNATMMTDDYHLYKRVAETTGRKHFTTNHSKYEYVRGDVHSNTVEGFFSLLKRGINGVFHHVGRGHLDRYCDEFAFRYENRKMSDGDRAKLIVTGAEGKRLTYDMPATAS
jgi:hypothetical protein